jgi:hypothetical protein
LSWGWHTISPRWRRLWGGDTTVNTPSDYKDDLIEQVVVILTDRRNQFHDNSIKSDSPKSNSTAYGRIEDQLATTSTSMGRTILDIRMSKTSGPMKNAGVKIYSLTFGTDVDSTSRTLFWTYASTPAMYSTHPAMQNSPARSASSATCSPSLEYCVAQVNQGSRGTRTARTGRIRGPAAQERRLPRRHSSCRSCL